MTAQEMADWFSSHGWVVMAVKPHVVTVHKGTSRRAYEWRTGCWVLTHRRGKRNQPGARGDEEGETL